MTTFTNTELEAIRLLVVKTRNSVVLQKKTALGLVEIEQIVEKIDSLLKETTSLPFGESKKDLFDISTDYNVMKITDIQNEIDYEIDMDLVYNGKIVGYLIEDRDEAISNIESWIGESNSESDKYLMREDLEYLRESSEDYVLNCCGTNGFISKDVDMKEFNKVCQELIESFTAYQNGEAK
ncbi:MAG: hypothetical protein PHE16_02985 [Aliarcobacter sp.]|nr:hypothetical protein [Aliarcobacter sp.]